MLHKRINIHKLIIYSVLLLFCNRKTARGLGAAAGGSHGTYLCIKEVMKNHGLQVAKLSRFKSGPNISVSYVSFLHAARDLFTAWPAYSVHNCAESFRADFSDSACK